MSDIVERLREAHPNSAQRWAGSNILLEAAYEIERLRKALQPFARIADMEENTRDGGSVTVNVNRCRDARAALDQDKGATGE